MAVVRKEVTVRFYGQWCLPVITWYKKNSLKQVLPTTSTLDKRSFTTAIFEEFWSESFSSRLKTVKHTLVYMSLTCISTEICLEK